MAAQATTKVKKKQWVQIVAPKAFDNVPLGETYVTEKEQVTVKSVTTNLMVLTDDPRQQGYLIRFDVTGVKDGKATTQPISLSMTPSAVKRLIRRGRDKVDDSFTLPIAGGRQVRIKPCVVTRTKASKAAQTEMRIALRAKLRELLLKLRFEDVVLDLIDGKVQRVLRDVCAKTHPVRSVDIREVTIVPQDRVISPEMAERLEKEAAEEDARREQMAAVVAAASVDEEIPAEPAPKKRTRKKVDADDGPDDMGV